MKTDSFQKDYTRSQAIAVTNGLQLGFKVAAKGVVALAGADSFITRTIKKSR
ncbi:epsilon-toxin family protein [Paenibacillus melissococcoides]|uniref:Epsilon-toxin family protein n=2 Tax=Paenibacillus TaxID=44249 RepID=A0ABN8UCN7_9BACL|nr:ETX/MTX2 family pore-forming toxin [Paenibacillus melissococcoides]MEB9895177.1 ETX/MTX2 family pore-forming toxin [Bacillus cereus]CAH8247852.1 epsilon-toxin family protein [Paenibacillus melissococcoides]CAH8719348.1 epsilon-toxin family protein [Paenibacillus melissococcoides]CAH8720356.1 epsilon-toxin family protein [Paenibacillus melissococcoides]